MDALFQLFIANAYAESAGAQPQPGGGYSFFIVLMVGFILIYFMAWRPQNKRAREQQNLLSSLAKGDEVMTAGGLLGRITKVSDQYLSISIAPNTDILVQKTSVVSILPKGTIKSIE